MSRDAFCEFDSVARMSIAVKKEFLTLHRGTQRTGTEKEDKEEEHDEH